MNKIGNLPSRALVIVVSGDRYALDLDVVDRVIAVTAIRPLPGAPDVVRGIIDVQGTLIPVIDLRYRFRLPGRPVELTDRLVLTRTRSRRLALLVDAVEGLVDVDCASSGDEIAGVAADPSIMGTIRCTNGIILIHDLERCLFPEEASRLDRALEG